MQVKSTVLMPLCEWDIESDSAIGGINGWDQKVPAHKRGHGGAAELHTKEPSHGATDRERRGTPELANSTNVSGNS